MRRHVLQPYRVADIFAQMNNKLGGDIEKIRTTGRYFVEIWKAIGMEGIGEKVPEAMLFLLTLVTMHGSITVYRAVYRMDPLQCRLR